MDAFPNDNNYHLHDHCHYDYPEVRMDAVSHLVEDFQLRDEPVSGETDDPLDWRSSSSSSVPRKLLSVRDLC